MTLNWGSTASRSIFFNSTLRCGTTDSATPPSRSANLVDEFRSVFLVNLGIGRGHANCLFGCMFFPSLRRYGKHSFACFGATLSGLAFLLSLQRPAWACSCASGTQLLVPSAARGLVRGMPLLVAAPERTTFELRNSSGASVSLSTLISAPFLGTCGGDVSLLAPAQPLDTDESYVLVSTTFFGAVTESEPFAVASHEPIAEAIPLEITAALEPVEPTAFGAGSCIDAQLQDRSIDTLLHIHVAAPLRTTLILTARVEEAISGPLIDARAPLASQLQGDLHLAIELPAEASRCADVQLVDLTAKPVFHELLCPEVDQPITRSLDLALRTVPEPPPTTATRDGCALTTTGRATPPPSFGWVVAVLLGLARRRRETSHAPLRGP